MRPLDLCYTSWLIIIVGMQTADPLGVSKCLLDLLEACIPSLTPISLFERPDERVETFVSIMSILVLNIKLGFHVRHGCRRFRKLLLEPLAFPPSLSDFDALDLFPSFNHLFAS